MDRAWVMAAAMVVAPAAFAESAADAVASGESAPQSAPDTSAIIMAPKAAVVSVARPATSGSVATPTGVAADITTSLPKFAQQAPPTPLEDQPDMRDIDKPRNKIPRLPANMMSTVIVHAKRVPEFRARDLYTKAGLIDLAMKEHPGYRVGNFFGLNRGAAYERFLEDERIEKIKDLDDTALAFAVGGDATEAKMILDETGDAFIRDLDTSGPIHMGSRPD